MKRLFVLLLSISISQAVSSQKAPHFDIEKAPAPLFRDPVFDGAADPSITWNAKTGEWWVFYTQRRATLNLPGVEYCYGTEIGVAISRDYGKTWEYRGAAKLFNPDQGKNTFWAPCVIQDKESKTYHMFVTYIKGVFSDWGGKRQMAHYSTTNLVDWKYEGMVGTGGCIDPTVFRIKDGSWKMWYKDEHKGSYTTSASSDDLKNWKPSGILEVRNRIHEAPIVFFWKGKYRMLTDPCYDDYTGLDSFESDDAVKWTFTGSILDKPGIRPDDNDQGRHPDVVIINDRAYVFYFTHPGRVYKNNIEVLENEYRYRRSSLEVAELELIDGKISCNRNKYSLKK
jgi:predicted GH43/DUF377 family glycosyl hydrolase